MITGARRHHNRRIIASPSIDRGMRGWGERVTRWVPPPLTQNVVVFRVKILYGYEKKFRTIILMNFSLSSEILVSVRVASRPKKDSKRAIVYLRPG